MKNLRLILILILYAVFSVLFFILHFFGLLIDNEFQFWTAFAVITGIVLSYGLLAFFIVHLENLNKRALVIGAFALIFFIMLFFLMPPPLYILNDLHIYFFHSKIFSVYQQNPYIHEPWEFANDPSYGSIEIWKNQNYNYGPLWLLISSIPHLFTKSIITGAAFYKYFALLFYLGLMCLVYQLWEKDLRKAFLFGINPIILYWGIMGGHNDMAMMFFLLLSFLLLKMKKYYWAIFTLALAVLIKYIAILMLPVFLLHIAKNSKVLPAIKSFLIFFAATIVAYLPFHIGFDIILGNKTLILPRLGGPFFTGAYVLANHSLDMDTKIFLYIKNIFFIIFLLGCGLILLKQWKKIKDFNSLSKIIFSILFWFFLSSYWFQPWYLVWVIPFLWLENQLKYAITVSAIIWYGLSFYFISYRYSSLFGFILTIMFFLPLYVFFICAKSNCFFQKKQVQ